MSSSFALCIWYSDNSLQPDYWFICSPCRIINDRITGNNVMVSKQYQNDFGFNNGTLYHNTRYWKMKRYKTLKNLIANNWELFL